jgi:predicted MFS family arabinose efflux permease
MTTASSQPLYAHPVRLILVLAIAPMIGLGICRFAYALVLPDMRDSLGWSYALAGFMNTLNACGYLAGALTANFVIRRIGMFEALRISAVACVLSLIVSSITVNLVLFGAARLLSGAAAALAFIAGGALAANVAQAQPRNQAFYLGFFYIGPAVGILVSGLSAPFLLEWSGPGSWWIVWAVLAALSVLLASILGVARVEEPQAQAGDQKVESRTLPILNYLIGYFLFGAGYIAYMTFMIAYVRNAGGGAFMQSLFWTCLGAGAFAQPWVWRGLLAEIRGGGITALLTLITAAGAVVPLIGQSPVFLVISAIVFGNAFFAVVSSTAAFARYNYPREAWPKAISLMTVAFSIGQSLGPIAIGAITDRLGSLSIALTVSAAILMASAAIFACQRSRRPGNLPGGIRVQAPPSK